MYRFGEILRAYETWAPRWAEWPQKNRARAAASRKEQRSNIFVFVFSPHPTSSGESSIKQRVPLCTKARGYSPPAPSVNLSHTERMVAGRNVRRVISIKLLRDSKLSWFGSKISPQVSEVRLSQLDMECSAAMNAKRTASVQKTKSEPLNYQLHPAVVLVEGNMNRL